MIAGDQLQETGLAAAVGPAQLPALVRFDRPVEALEDQVLGVADGRTRESDERHLGIERRELGGRVGRGDLEVARLEVEQLVELGVGLLVRTLDTQRQVAVVDVGDVGDEVGALIEAVEHDHHRRRPGELTQVALKPGQRIVIESVEGFVEHEQVRPAGERPDEHDLAGLAGRELAEGTPHQRPQAQRVDQGLGQLEVLAAVLDDLGDRRALRDHVEDVSVVLTPLGRDQLGLPLVRHERDSIGNPREGSRQVIAIAGEHGRESRLAGTVGAGDQPVLTRLDRPVDVVELKALVEVDRQRVQADHASAIRRCASCRPCGRGARCRWPRPGGCGSPR